MHQAFNIEVRNLVVAEILLIVLRGRVGLLANPSLRDIQYLPLLPDALAHELV